MSRSRRINPGQRTGEGRQAPYRGRQPAKVAKRDSIAEVISNAAGCLKGLEASFTSERRDPFPLRWGQTLTPGSSPPASQCSCHLRSIHAPILYLPLSKSDGGVS